MARSHCSLNLAVVVQIAGLSQIGEVMSEYLDRAVLSEQIVSYTERQALPMCADV